MENVFKIKSITGQIHDTGSGSGCLPYKIVVMVEISVFEFNKLCPVTIKAKNTLCGKQAARRDLGNLVLDVNNAVYKFNSSIPAHYPSIDSKGSRRSKNGVKILEFVYFMGKNDHDKAEKLGFELKRFKNGEVYTSYNQYINIKQGVN